MRVFHAFALALAVMAVGTVVAGDSADARHRRHHWNPTGKCYDPVEGVGTGTGVFGRGSAKARRAARSDWESNVASRYGLEFARLHLARNVSWDCKKRAVLLAKCVVVATPCGARLRG